MVRRRVESRATTSATADQAWSVVRDFCAPWHPLIETMRPEAGGTIRRFTVKDDDTVYRERLTWFSDSERSMGYTMLEGIAGADRYDGRLTITPTATGAAVTMSAQISATTERCDQIAEGTQVIFDMGIAHIAELAQQVEERPNVTPLSRDVETEDIEIDTLPRLALTVAGKPSETLVLLLHGIGGGRANWSRQVAAIAPLCRVAALDLRGYGDSSLGMAQSSVDDYCDDILRVLDVLGAKRLVLCGLSYGAWIATSFAQRYPEKLAGLVVSGGCTGMSEAGPDEREAFRLSREVPLTEGQTPADFAPSVVKAIAGPGASEQVRADLHQSMAAIPAATYADALRCFTNPLEQFDFSKLNMPVLAMTGEHDRLAPPAEIKNVAERIFDAPPKSFVRFEVIGGAGHVCNLEKPDAYNRPLLEFINQLLA